MALKLNERYPGRFTNPSGDYPQGSFKNRTTPTAKDGSYLEKDWANDKEGFFQSLLAGAGITADGSVDKVGASQYIDALMSVIRTERNLRSGSAGGFGRRNILINADGKIKVRPYASGAATSVANQYTLDRWYVVVSGQNVSWVDSGGVRTITCPAGGLSQAIRAEDIIGGTYVINWTGTATCQINGVSILKGGTVVLPPAVIARVKFSSGTLVSPQLEIGTVPTDFDKQNTSAEEVICQKYYYRVDLTWLIQGFTSSAAQRIPDAFLTYPKMIGNPVVTFSNGGGVNVSVGTMSAIAGGLTQTAASVASGYSSYSLTINAIDAEFT